MSLETKLANILKDFEGVRYTQDNMHDIQAKISLYLRSSPDFPLRIRPVDKRDLEGRVMYYKLEFKEDK